MNILYLIGWLVLAVLCMVGTSLVLSLIKPADKPFYHDSKCQCPGCCR